MRMHRSLPAAGLLVLVGVALLPLGPRLAGAQAAARHPVSWATAVGPDRAALAVAGLACWLVLLWLATGVLLMTATALPGVVGRVADVAACRLLPGSVRRIAVGALGLSLTASAAACSGVTPRAAPPADAGRLPPSVGSAQYAPGVDWPIGTPTTAAPPVSPAPPEPSASAASSTAGGPGPPPGRSTGSSGDPAKPHPSARPGPAPGQPAAPTADSGRSAGSGPRSRPGHLVTVRAGDCLWLIAARRLAPDATAAQVAAEARRWYAANATRIGADPDLLHPGQVLAAPPGRRP